MKALVPSQVQNAPEIPLIGPSIGKTRACFVAGVDAVAIASHRQFTCAIVTSGDVACWGNNQFATLAQPASAVPVDTATPQRVAW